MAEIRDSSADIRAFTKRSRNERAKDKVPFRTKITAMVIFGTGVSALGYGVLLRALGSTTGWGLLSYELFIEGLVYMLVGLGDIFAALSIYRQSDYGDALGWGVSGILTFMYIFFPSFYFFSSIRLLGFGLCLMSFLTLIVKNPKRDEQKRDPV